LAVLLKRLREEPFAQAAVAYFVYGGWYLFGAVAALSEERKAEAGSLWWVFYLVGALLWFGVPALIWRRGRLALWICRLFPFATAGKALVLGGRLGQVLRQGETPSVHQVVFSVLALVATFMLARAGWGSGVPGR
jgi:hypothetical protein